MASMRKSRVLHGLAGCAVALAMVGFTPAMAGENNGRGLETGAPTHANSICAFSGLNDDPGSVPFGKIQSWGWTMRFFDLVARFFNPGDVCRGGSNVPEV
jgi:hypothetical protein